MPKIEIRPAVQDDLDALIAIDHSYESQNTFQVDVSSLESGYNVQLRSIKIPRSHTVQYPRSGESLLLSWQKATAIFLACLDAEIVSYIALEECQSQSLIRIRDIAVKRENRQQGIASGLLLASEGWAARLKKSNLLIEMQTKNYPALALATKLGYQFCGFQDHYFPNNDMALFFSKYVH